MDKKEFLQEIIDIHNNWTVVSGMIDIVRCEGISHFVPKLKWNSDKVNPLANNFTEDDFWFIIGKGTKEVIFESLSEHEYEVDREGFYNFNAILKYYRGDYDEYGRMTMPDYFEIYYIELDFIETFEARDREDKLNQILSYDFDNLFNLN